jgi:uncharacterized protein (TIGR00156 family)
MWGRARAFSMTADGPATDKGPWCAEMCRTAAFTSHQQYGLRERKKEMSRLVVFAVALTVLGIAMPTAAQFVGPGTPATVDVKSVLANPVDDMWVILKGYLLQKVGRDKYTFSDGSGQIRLDIDDKYFPPGVPITPKTYIQISGKVDVEHYRSPEIDVKNIVVLPEGGAGTASPGGFQPK